MQLPAGFVVVACAVLAFAYHVDGRTIQWFQTAENTTDRLTPQPAVTFSASKPSKAADSTLSVNETTRYQTMLGFGGAFTDSAVTVLNSMPKDKYDQVMDLYFGPDGLDYSFGRIPMGSCDFTTDPGWNYDNHTNDVTLDHFSVDHDVSTGKIKIIQDAIARRTKANATSPFKLLGSPWSAPGWMKSNGAMICGLNVILTGCHLKNTSAIHASYAYYFAAWVNEYRKLGLPVWGVTVQNEPQENILTYSGMVFTPETERDFVKDFLGPVLTAKAPNTNILYLDHNKDKLPSWADVVLGDPEAAKYLWGAAIHWYTGDHFDDVAEVNAKFPSKGILATEATAVPDWKLAPEGGKWDTASHYLHDALGDFNAGVTGFIDWNLMLNAHGGPMHVNFLVLNGSNSDAMIVYDDKANEVYVQTFYYFVGHFSKFVPEGSVRVEWTLSPASNTTLQSCAFVTPAGDTVVIVLNQNSVPLTYTVEDGGEYAQFTCPAHAAQTLVFPSPGGVAAPPPPPETYVHAATETPPSQRYHSA